MLLKSFYLGRQNVVAWKRCERRCDVKKKRREGREEKKTASIYATYGSYGDHEDNNW